MSKKLWAFFLTVILVCCMTAAFADTVHVSDEASFKAAWNRASAGVTIVLDGNISLSSEYVLSGSGQVTIDLNGHSISGTGTSAESVFKLTGSSALTVADTAGGGSVAVTTTGKSYRQTVLVKDSAKFTLNSSTLKGNSDTDCRIVMVKSGAGFVMNGGVLSGNTYKGNGSAVYIDNGSFTMTGGEITGNTCNASSWDGSASGTVYYDGSSSTTFTMTGGDIHDNKAIMGGGVNINDGKAVLSGGTIRNNTAVSGAGIYAEDGCDGLTLTGSLVITGNTKTGTMLEGAGVACEYDKLWSSGQGYKIYLGGRVQIAGNSPNDLMLSLIIEDVVINSDLDTSPENHAWIGLSGDWTLSDERLYELFRFDTSASAPDHTVCFFPQNGVKEFAVLSEQKNGKTPNLYLVMNRSDPAEITLNYNAMRDKDGDHLSEGVDYTFVNDTANFTLTIDSQRGMYVDELTHFLTSTNPEFQGAELVRDTETPEDDGTRHKLIYLCKFVGNGSDGTVYERNIYYTVNLKLYNRTVSFELNGCGTPIPEQTVEDGDRPKQPADPTADGMVFEGWYKDSEMTEAFDFLAPVTEDTVVFAKWSTVPVYYTVNFEMNGHGDPVTYQVVQGGQTATEPEEPTDPVCTFSYWSGDPECLSPYDFSTPITQDTVLYALWAQSGPAPLTYTLTFIMNGYGDQVPYQVVQAGDLPDVPSPAPEEPGWSFGGWYSDQALQNSFDFSAPLTGNTTVYAKWEGNTYDVTFDLNYDTDPREEIRQEQNGTCYVLPDDPVRSGYTFDGWYTQKTDGDKVTSSTAVALTGPKTLYAHWTKVTEEPTYTPPEAREGLRYNGSAQALVYPGRTRDGTMLYAVTQSPDTPADGWKETPDPMTEVGTYYVHYYVQGDEQHKDSEPGTVTVSIAKGAPDYTEPKAINELYENGGDQALITAGTARSGKMLYALGTADAAPEDGWTENASAIMGKDAGTYYVYFQVTGDENHDALPPSCIAVTIGIQTVTVSFDTNGHGTAPDDMEDIPVGSTITEPEAPGETGYFFEGWYREESCENKWNFDTDTVTEDVTLYAKWTADVYLVQFVTNGGTAVDPQSVTFGEKAKKPADPVRNEYVFDGWYTDAALTEAYDFDSPVKGDLTLYAGWQIAPPSVVQTGDRGMPGLYALIMLIAAAGIALTLGKKRV